MEHFVYILLSDDGRYYTGYTTDLDRRFKEHQSGSGGKFTRSFGANKILYRESYGTKSAALQREAQIKGLTRAKKAALIRSSIGPL
ncbi:MAG: GIY-YIG nuclease family protein [Deltaproteobacteria bacterium]|nr:GIY-YIG nuclease family protein [Deltaproteobacteria bacterium]